MIAHFVAQNNPIRVNGLGFYLFWGFTCYCGSETLQKSKAVEEYF
jgi:hypothetical protein